MKGQEKALELVMVLFLLIVAVYLILTFFQSSLGEQIGKLSEIQSKEELNKEAQSLVDYCSNLCKKYKTSHSNKDLYEFCTSFKEIDLNEDGKLDYAEKSAISSISLGGVGVCEDAVPCFVIVDCNVGGEIDAHVCKDAICERLDELNLTEMMKSQRLNQVFDPGTCYKQTQTFHWFNLAFPSKKPGELSC